MFDYEETIDFLNDFKDMCNEQDCSKCPLNCGFLLRNDPETVIKILQKWNEDNGNYQREDFDKAVKSGVEQAMKEKLKPCPFCGGKSWVLKIPNESNKKYVVVCKDDDCGASLGNYSETREEAINAWNKRAKSYVRRKKNDT